MSVLEPVLLHERDAAEILGVSVSWLQKQRWAGTGPAYIRVGGRANGAIRYRLSDLHAWIEQNRVVPNATRRG
jgi:predicted DNA-binding transcriptional regulator AlpA